MIKKKLRVLNYPFVLTRKEKKLDKEILLIYSFLGKELFELDKEFEIKSFELIDGKKTAEEIANKIIESFKEIKKEKVVRFLNELKDYAVITDRKINPFKIEKTGNAVDMHKAFLDYLRVANIKNLSFPLRLRILLTLRCNMNCSYCYLRSGKIYREESKDEISFEQIKKIIDEMLKNGSYILDLSGGEPFLRKDILEIIKYASDRIPFIYILTNGIALADENLVKKISKIVKNKAVVIQISLDSANAKNSLRSEDERVYQKVLDGIKNSIKHNLLININTVVTKSNINEIEEIIKLSKKLGVKSHSFSEFVPVSCSKDIIRKYLPSPYEYYKLQNEIIPRLQEKYKGILLIGKIVEPEFWDDIRKNKLETPTYGSCAAFTTDLTIGPDGRVLPCAWFAAFPEFYGPNIKNKSLKEIWDKSELAKKFRNIIVKGKCERCQFNQICYKGCFALKYSIYKKLDIPDIKCWYDPEDPSSKKYPKEIPKTILGEEKL